MTAERAPSFADRLANTGGETGRIIATTAWAATPLGPIDAWPERLKWLVEMMVHTRQPAYLAWGTEQISLYNDGYLPILGLKHPHGMGQPAHLLWSEVWDTLGPINARVLAGESQWFEDMPFQLAGRHIPQSWFSFSYTPVAGDDGRPLGIYCVAVETTDKVLADRRARAEYERLLQTFEQAPGFIIVMLGPEHVVEYVNAAHRRMFGSREWVGRTIRESFPDISGQGFFELLDQVYATGERHVAYSAPARFRRPGTVETEERRLDFIYEAMRDATGAVTGILCEGYDATEAYRMQTALRESEERLRMASEAAQIGIWDYDLITNTLRWDQRTRALFGLSTDATVTYDVFLAGLHPDDRDVTHTANQRALEPTGNGEYDIEYRTVGLEDGITRWIAAKGKCYFENGQAVRYIGTVLDIGPAKQAEEALRLSEARLRTLNADLEQQVIQRTLARGRVWHLTPDLMGVLNADGYWEASNPAWQTLLGWSEAEVASTVFLDFIHPDDRSNAEQSWYNSIKRGLPVIHFENRYRTKAGEWRWLSWVAVPEGDKVYCTARDITAARAQAAALVERTAERDRVWRNSRDLLVVIGADGIFRAVNPAWTNILGHEPAEVIGRSVYDFIWPEDADLTRRGLEDAAAASDLTNFENRYTHKDGWPRWISWHTSVEGELIYAYGRDITADKAAAKELEQAQDALRQAQKMEAVGQLTGGIAHDFNNLLGAVVGSLDLIRRRPNEVDRVRRYAEAGLQAAERGAKLTGQLLAFSRAQRIELRPVLTGELLRNMEELLSRTLGPMVRLQVDHRCGGAVLSDPTQLEMAVLNLAINARDAMASGGDLTISAAKRQIGKDAELTPGDYIEIAVADTGIGMPADVVARAIDPFFTTKGVGKGTGLGLSQVYGVARQAGGTVRIESTPGKGTTVRVLLPKTNAKLTAQAEAGAASADPDTLSATILVVDDDHDIRRVLIDSLETLGYGVVEAADGPAGLAALESSVPDLMVVDFAMPGMNGAEVAKAARRLRPEIPIVFASGYADTAAIESVAGAQAKVLRKPFRVNELQAVVAEALGRA